MSYIHKHTPTTSEQPPPTPNNLHHQTHPQPPPPPATIQATLANASAKQHLRFGQLKEDANKQLLRFGQLKEDANKPTKEADPASPEQTRSSVHRVGRPRGTHLHCHEQEEAEAFQRGGQAEA